MLWPKASQSRTSFPYPQAVRFQIRANVLQNYQLATDFLNINRIDIGIVEYEYGLCGACSGKTVLKLVRNARMPVITTLHTVLSQPDRNQATVRTGIVAESDRLVVMSQRRWAAGGEDGDSAN